MSQQKYVYYLCGQSSSRKHNLTVHMKTHMERARNWKCTECSKCFYRKSDLARHELVHKVKQFQCELCTKMFARIDAKQRHCRNIHGMSIPKKCRAECSVEVEPIVECQRPSLSLTDLLNCDFELFGNMFQ